MAKRYGTIASLEGYHGERLLIHKVKKDLVLMTVEDDQEDEKTTKWYRLRYEVIDGYNQKITRLPYIVYKQDVYAIDDFHEWKRGG